MAFWKDYTLQGCTILTTSTVRLLAWSLVLVLGGWQSGCGYNLYLAGASPKGHWWSGSPTSVPTTLLDRGHLLHTPSSFNFFHRHAHANGKLKLKDPWRHPHKLVVVRDLPIHPTDGSTLSPGSRGKELTPRGKNEAKHHHATMATHPSLLENY